jgi:hypothetical protein
MPKRILHVSTSMAKVQEERLVEEEHMEVNMGTKA